MNRPRSLLLSLLTLLALLVGLAAGPAQAASAPASLTLEAAVGRSTPLTSAHVRPNPLQTGITPRAAAHAYDRNAVATGVAAEARVPSQIFREGTPSPSNLRVRPGEDAVSFRDSLSNPWVPPAERPPNWRPVFRRGEPYFSLDTAKLPPGSVVPDNVPPGHVSVKGVDPGVLRDAVIESPPWPRLPK